MCVHVTGGLGWCPEATQMSLYLLSVCLLFARSSVFLRKEQHCRLILGASKEALQASQVCALMKEVVS